MLMNTQIVLNLSLTFVEIKDLLFSTCARDLKLENALVDETTVTTQLYKLIQ